MKSLIRIYNNKSLKEKVKIKRYYRDIGKNFDALNIINHSVQQFSDAIVWELEIKSLE